MQHGEDGARECEGEEAEVLMTDDEMLYGVPGATYQGLLTKPTTRPLPEGTMTRQRRRAEARRRQG